METYTEEEKNIYDEILKNKLSNIGYTPKEHELYIMKIGCKYELSYKKGEKYILTDEEQEQMANIWKTYGEPNIYQ